MLTDFNDFAKVNENSFWSWLTGKSARPHKLPDIKANELYADFENFINSKKAVIFNSEDKPQYYKLIHEIQIALTVLGYSLPVNGIDGLFGPETYQVLSDFKTGSQPYSPPPTNELIVNFSTFSKLVDESANGQLTPAELKSIDGENKLNPIAAKAYLAMKAAAEADGVTWEISDSYRNYDEQERIADEEGLYSQGGKAAAPGTSNHGWGSAIDFLNLDSNPEAVDWLQKNAAKYGFSNIPREIWHWEHKASAKAMKSGQPVTAGGLLTIDAVLINKLLQGLKDKNFSDADIAKLKGSQVTQVTNDDLFYRGILKMLGAKETQEKMNFLKAWRQAEGGTAKNNPFNTTKQLKTSGITSYNSAKVKHYPNSSTGLAATVATLKLPAYSDIVSMLKDDSITAAQLSKAKSLYTWGTGDGIARVLAGGNINPPPIAT